MAEAHRAPPRRRLVLVALVAAAAAVAVTSGIFILSDRGGRPAGPSGPAAAGPTSARPAATTPGGTDGVTGTVPVTTAAQAGAGTATTAAPAGSVKAPSAVFSDDVVPGAAMASVPVRTSQSREVSGGDVVQTIHLVADPGSSIYGAEARLCPADQTIAYDADFHPTQTGRCALNPLSATADSHVEVVGTAPYSSLDLRFRSATGTDRYTRQDGRAIAITCDQAHPCAVVVKVQVPGGFGFVPFPVTAA